MSINSSWIKFAQPNPQASMRLFCLPYAGAGTSVFRLWPRQLPAHIELGAVAFPGREMRMSETPISNLAILLEQLADAIIPYLDKPFAIFGHSMGSIVSFELTKILEAKGYSPLCVFVSGSSGPQVPEKIRTLHLLSDDEFVEQLSARYNAIPEVFLNDKALLALLLPILRADIKLLETYVYQESGFLQCPIFALGSVEDPEATHACIESWQKNTNGAFFSKMFPGDHFYLNSHQSLLLSYLSEVLSSNPF